MPGKNNNKDDSRYHWFIVYWAERTYKLVVFAVFILQIWGVTRFYLTIPHLGICPESVTFSVFFLFCDWMVFKGLYRTKDADPGYMIPKKEDNELQPIVRNKSTKADDDDNIGEGDGQND